MFVHIILTDLKEKQGFLISSLHIPFSPLIAESNIKYSREKVIYQEEEFWDYWRIRLSLHYETTVSELGHYFL